MKSFWKKSIWKFGSNKWEGVDFAGLVPEVIVSHQLADASSSVVLLVPRYRDPLFGRFLQPRLPEQKRFVKVPLDTRGSFLWPLLDGKRTILDLSREFATTFPEDSEQSDQRISAYLHRMYENRLIRFINLA